MRRNNHEPDGEFSPVRPLLFQLKDRLELESRCESEHSAEPSRRPRLVAFLNSYSAGMSGGDAYFIEIAKLLTGWDVTVVTSALGAAVCRDRGLRCEFWITTRESEFHRVILTYVLRTIKAIWMLRCVREGDVVYATSDFFPDVLPAAIVRLLEPQTVWVQRIYHLIPRQRRISHQAQRVSLALIRHVADLSLPDNSLLQGDLIRSGFRSERIAVSYLGIDLQWLRKSEPACPPSLDAVCLARLHRAKGIFTLVDIWALVCQVKPAATLALIGHGDAETVKSLQSDIRRRGLETNIRLLGFMHTREAISILQQARIFVSASLEEGFGMAILEAVASGLPVVAWDLPVYHEVFPDTLVTVPIADTQQFARSVLDLLENAKRRELLIAMGRNIAQRYDWQALAEIESRRFHACLHGALGRRLRSPRANRG